MTWQVVMPAEDLVDALTGKGTNPGNCQLTGFETRVREGQIEILAPGPG